MARLRYELKDALGQKNIEQLHQKAVGLIEELGIEVAHKRTLDLLGGHDGVKIKGTRAHFSRELVDELTIRRPYMPPEGHKMTIRAGVYCLNILDMDTQKVRPATSRDLVDMVKLADATGMVGETPLDPQDIPPGLREVAMCKICWENSESISGGYILTEEAAEYVYEMAQVLNKPFSLGGTVIVSPMKLNGDRMDLFLRFRDRGVPVGFGGMPLLGATAPIFYGDAYIQSMAEELAAGVVTTLVFGSDGATGCATVYPFDMKDSTVVYGSAERVLSMLFAAEVARFYGFQGRSDSLLTSAKEPDSQAAAEKMANTLLCALSGSRSFAYAGTLSLDNIFSPEQLLIDKDIVDYIQHFIKGFEFDPESSPTELIREGMAEGGFLGHRTTVANFRDVYMFPELFEHSVFSQWHRDGEKSLRSRARDIAKEKIAAHNFRLPADKQVEVDKIYQRATKSLVG